MRLGGPVYVENMTPESWIAAHKSAGYGAAYCPVEANASDAEIAAYVQAAKDANIIIAEVGAWSNPLDPNPETRQQAMSKCKTQLELAEKVGARCCVNISGSRGDVWDGPHPANLTQETFDMIVAYVREILDDVQPSNTYYSLEPMPWMYPDTADSYLRLIEAVDRPQFGAHIDMVNVINSPQAYFANAALTREWFSKLAPYIRSCHAKDSLISTKLTTHLDEVRPGMGDVDYGVLLNAINALDPDIPLMIEHLHKAEDYELAAAYIREVAEKNNLHFLP